jgi:choline dehydrogenase
MTIIATFQNRKSFCPRGKTLGGSSSINAMVYIRGQPEDYDEWNIPGWSWKDMLPHFKETEKQLSMVFPLYQ